MNYNKLLKIWEEHYQELLKISIKITNNQASAEDVLSIIMLKIWEQKEELQIKNYYGYLRTTVRNRSLNFKRDYKRKREVSYEDNLYYELS